MHFISALTVILIASSFVSAQCQELLCLVNQERGQYGLPNLALNSALMGAAQEQSYYQSRVGMTHTGSGGTSAATRIRNHGYSSTWSSGENVAQASSSVQEVMNMWMSSGGHAANILDPTYTHMGCAVTYSSGGYGYWTQTFAGDGRQHNYPSCSSGNVSRKTTTTVSNPQSTTLDQSNGSGGLIGWFTGSSSNTARAQTSRDLVIEV